MGTMPWRRDFTFGFIHINGHDAVAQRGQAGAGNQSDVATSDDSNIH